MACLSLGEVLGPGIHDQPSLRSLEFCVGKSEKNEEEKGEGEREEKRERERERV